MVRVFKFYEVIFSYTESKSCLAGIFPDRAVDNKYIE